MELAILHNGQVFTVDVDGLEDYDLSKPFTRVVIMESLALEVARILKYEESES